MKGRQIGTKGTANNNKTHYPLEETIRIPGFSSGSKQTSKIEDAFSKAQKILAEKKRNWKIAKTAGYKGTFKQYCEGM